MTQSTINRRFNRRRFLSMSAGASVAALAAGVGRHAAGDELASAADRKLLFVIAATGGASIIDSFLPVVRSEVSDGSIADGLNVYEDDEVAQPQGSNIRCVRPLGNTDPWTNEYDLTTFLEHHHQDTVVLAHDVTSVNHFVASGRAVSGADVDRGRTIMEAAAERHGGDLLLPNCNMARGGYLEGGDDPGLPAWARGEVIAAPTVFASAMDGSRGIPGAPAQDLLMRARGVRDDLETHGEFGRTFANSKLRQDYLAYRDERQPSLEAADLITKLQLLPSESLPPEYGLQSSPQLETVRAAFPNYLEDGWEAQGALAFLLAYYGVACSATIGVETEPIFQGADIVGTPLAFDYSHTNHRAAQSVMWGRIAKVLDGLISALKATDYLGDPSLGKMWDRSLVYVATDFGRERTRSSPEEDFGTAHHLNNGALLVSPLLHGNKVYGGVDPETTLTFGYDRNTGKADKSQVQREGDVYSVIAQALDIEFPGRRDSAVVRS